MSFSPKHDNEDLIYFFLIFETLGYYNNFLKHVNNLINYLNSQDDTSIYKQKKNHFDFTNNYRYSYQFKQTNYIQNKKMINYHKYRSR